ncbi:MAG: IS91 family transposase [Anaerolineae bacterium]|nr:IS91 family transposase [Anaerolineae bacterium]
MVETAYVSVRQTQTDFEVADVLRLYGEQYRAQYPVTPEQARVMGALTACRTAQLGGHVNVCQDCGAVQIAYNACRDRHCPKCGKFKKAQWLENQQVMLLPIPYFHVVFTTDHALNTLVPDNQRAIYNLLFQTATASLKQLGQQELGGQVGITAVLHTWSQRLNPHVHLHCIVTGGALTDDRRRWVACRPGYLVDVVALSALFRAKFCRGLRRLARQGRLHLPAEVDVADLITEIETKKWQVFAKEFQQPEAVYEYLSRYVNQVAISNYRITAIAQGQVSFSYYDNLDQGQQKVLTLPVVEFIRRFLWHVLPTGFVRIRYYGLHHSSARPEILPRCRRLLGLTASLPEPEPLILALWLESVIGVELHRCPFCGQSGTMTRWGEVEQMSWLWLMLKVVVGLVTPRPVPV